jgi:hypothetical protein
MDIWLQSSNVSVENNIAVSCSGDAYKVFSDDASMPATHRFKIPKANILNPEIAGVDDFHLYCCSSTSKI